MNAGATSCSRPSRRRATPQTEEQSSAATCRAAEALQRCSHSAATSSAPRQRDFPSPAPSQSGTYRGCPRSCRALTGRTRKAPQYLLRVRVEIINDLQEPGQHALHLVSGHRNYAALRYRRLSNVRIQERFILTYQSTGPHHQDY